MCIQSTSHDYFNLYSLSDFYELTTIKTAGDMVVKKNYMGGGAWVAQLIKPLTLGFGSGHNLVDCEFKSYIRFCADSAEPV